MRAYEINGIEYDSEFCRSVLRYERTFKRRMAQLFASENDVRTFLKGVYVDWMLVHPLRKELPEEARFPLKVAKANLTVPRLAEGRTMVDVQQLKDEMLRTIDTVVPLFGADSKNNWFVALHLNSSPWGFVELVSQIVVSELLSDDDVGIKDVTAWRPHWRGGLL